MQGNTVLYEKISWVLTGAYCLSGLNHQCLNFGRAESKREGEEILCFVTFLGD